VVPAALLDAMAAVRRDEVLYTALPSWWAPATAGMLASLRPDVMEVLGVAREGQAAVNAAQQLQQQVRLV
jgi:hypothetical protein